MPSLPEIVAPERLVAILRAAGEPTRLRLLALLREGELTVTDMQRALEQSQPRISRHLRLLAEAGLIERRREGSWTYLRLADDARDWLPALDRLDAGDEEFAADRARLAEIRTEHAEEAARFFAANAADWDRIRALQAPEETVEAAMLEAVGPEPVGRMLDLGTGTGRMLELFAPLYSEATGIDASREMLAIARARLAKAGLRKAAIRRADLFEHGEPDGAFDLVVVHQVLHFLDRPGEAVTGAARLLAPRGRIVIADFAGHDHEFLRIEQAHRRLGFAAGTIERWLAEAGLETGVTRSVPPDEPDGLTVLVWTARRTG